jgi:hypothetical protein
MPGIELGFATSTIIILALVLGAAAAAALFYRFTLPPVTTARRVVLSALRGSVLALLLLLLFEPFLRLLFTSTEPPVLAVLVDNSRSMQLVDRAGDRAGKLHSLIAGNSIQRHAAGVELQWYTFGHQLRPFDPSLTDSLALDEDVTDISSALRSLAQKKEQRNLQGVLLLTDGGYNRGQNPIHEAQQMGIPVFAVGIGDSSEQKDVLISKVAANELVYSETESPVDVTVRSTGYDGDRVEVSLLEGARELDRKAITLGAGTREYAVRLSYVPEGDGVKKFTVRVSSLPEELTLKNNSQTFFARILKSKLRVLIIAGAPSPDVSILGQTLREEKNIDVRAFVQRSPGEFYEGALTGRAVDSADCLLLIGFPTAAASTESMELIRKATVQDRKPLFFIHGRTVDEAKLSMFNPVLPFTQSGASTVEQYVFLHPSESQTLHPVLTAGQSDGRTAWNRLPPVFQTQATFRAKPEATVLGFARVQTVVLHEPLLVSRNVNRQKSLAFLGYGLWRWRLMAQGSPETSQVLSMFLANGIRWLTTREDDRPVKVQTTKEVYVQGEPVEFIGQVYDASAQPVEQAELRVAAQREGRAYETILRPIGSGRYEGSIEGLPEGDYTYRASARTTGQPVGDDNGRFTIGEANLEFQDTRMNATLLRQLAYRTGGEYFTPETIGELSAELTARGSFTPRELTRNKDIELWNWEYLLALIVLLLGAEWFIRKQSGMM